MACFLSDRDKAAKSFSQTSTLRTSSGGHAFCKSDQKTPPALVDSVFCESVFGRLSIDHVGFTGDGSPASANTYVDEVVSGASLDASDNASLTSSSVRVGPGSSRIS